MALIDISNIHKNYSAQKVLQGVDFTLEAGERVSLIGKNGSGKSTLIKIIEGSVDIDEGQIIIQNGLKIEMLIQDPKFTPGLTVRESIEEGLKELKEARLEYEKVAAEVGEDHENIALQERLSELGGFLDAHNAWSLDDKLARAIKELFLEELEHSHIMSLSGGEQRRVALAILLLKKPDILLLDEPTNHLDASSVEFLEELILAEKFTMIFISHDRYFIDRVATRTVEIDNGKNYNFSGGYADYLRQKEMLLSNMATEHENLLKILKGEEEWLSRGVKARLKRNEGRKQRVFALREQAKKNPSEIRKIKLQLERERKHFNAGAQQNRQKQMFELENISIKFGERELVKNFSLRVLQKDRIAIVGKNGAGKSTLIKTLLGEVPLSGGKIKNGDFTIGYFDQSRTHLDDDKNIMETFCPNGGDRVDVYGKSYHVFGYLKNFLFPKEYLDKKIGILSGGEKNRVALALLFTKKVDCLILDEPTNDLDIPTINILEEYIRNFEGCVIFVSHDRYFVDKMAGKLLVFKGGGVVEESYESYTEYLENEKEMAELDELERESQNSWQEVTTPAPQAVEVPKVEEPKKLSYKDKLEYEKLPVDIEKLEAKIKEIENGLSDPAIYQEVGLGKLADELETTKATLEAKVARYFEIEEKLEKLGLC